MGVAAEVVDIGPGPFQGGSLVVEAEVGRSAGRRKVRGGEEAEDVEAVGGRDDDAFTVGLGDEGDRVYGVRVAELEESAVFMFSVVYRMKPRQRERDEESCEIELRNTYG